MPKRKKSSKIVSIDVDENLQRLLSETGTSPKEFLKVASEVLPRIPRYFANEMRGGNDPKSTILKMFDSATIGRGVLKDIEEALGVKGFLVDEANCEVKVPSAGDFRVWVHMNASIDLTKSINLYGVDVDIDRSGVQVIYGRGLEKLTESQKERINREVSNNQESYCDELTQACENYELSFDDMDDEYCDLQLTVECEELEDAPKAEEVSKVFDKICA